jgi:predicted dinucleotide-binding enzyme
LVKDAGFDPVKFGSLIEARRFDPGSPVYNTGMTGAEIRQALTPTQG